MKNFRKIDEEIFGKIYLFKSSIDLQIFLRSFEDF